MTPGALACLLTAALATGGQERSGGGSAPSPAGAESPADRRGGRDEAFKMIDAYVVSNMQESLQLTDEQFVKLLPLVKRLQTDRRSLLLRRQQPLMELRRRLAAGGATEAEIAELLKQVKAAEAEEPVVLKKDRDAIDAALSPVQQAKFRVFEADVEHKIRELMAEIRGQRRGGAARAPARRPPQP